MSAATPGGPQRRAPRGRVLRHPAGRAVTWTLAVAVVASGLFASVGVPFFTTRAAGGAEAPATWVASDDAVSGVLTTDAVVAGTASPAEYAYGLDYAGDVTGSGQAITGQEIPGADGAPPVRDRVLRILEGDTLTGAAAAWAPAATADTADAADGSGTDGAAENAGDTGAGESTDGSGDSAASDGAASDGNASDGKAGDSTTAAGSPAAVLVQGLPGAALDASLGGALQVTDRAPANGAAQARWQLTDAHSADVNYEGGPVTLQAGTADTITAGIGARVQVFVVDPKLEVVLEACTTGTECDPDAPASADGWTSDAHLVSGVETVTWRVTATNPGNVDFTDVQTGTAVSGTEPVPGGSGVPLGSIAVGGQATATFTTPASDVAATVGVSVSGVFTAVGPDGKDLAARFTDLAGVQGRVPSPTATATASAPGDTASTEGDGETGATGDDSASGDETVDGGTDGASDGSENADGSSDEATADDAPGSDAEPVKPKAPAEGVFVSGTVLTDPEGKGEKVDKPKPSVSPSLASWPLTGVVVSLNDSDPDTPARSTLTDADGKYSFSRAELADWLAASTAPYTVSIVTPDGYEVEKNVTEANAFTGDGTNGEAAKLADAKSGAEYDALVVFAPVPATVSRPTTRALSAITPALGEAGPAMQCVPAALWILRSGVIPPRYEDAASNPYLDVYRLSSDGMPTLARTVVAATPLNDIAIGPDGKLWGSVSHTPNANGLIDGVTGATTYVAGAYPFPTGLGASPNPNTLYYMSGNGARAGDEQFTPGPGGGTFTQSTVWQSGPIPPAQVPAGQVIGAGDVSWLPGSKGMIGYVTQVPWSPSMSYGSYPPGVYYFDPTSQFSLPVRLATLDPQMVGNTGGA